ncbi:HTTM domain-containing protein [Actinomycetospora sp. CA-101289]|uniref:HTTM domain-containing protein n=1 Tax=Actinomycetospora sp. CA-101289 TaxID=3239893 RepID=UPI003D96E77A
MGKLGTRLSTAPLPRSVSAAWGRFWFLPESTAPIELFRIAFGALTVLWTLSLAPTLMAFYGPGAAVPETPALESGAWTLFSLIHSPSVIWVVWFATLLAAVGVLVGYRTRLAAAIVFVAMLSFERQAPNVFNTGDFLLRMLALYLALSPAGTAVSADRWFSGAAPIWSFPRRAPWALRLMQIQLSALYLSAVWEKVQGQLWREGSAVSYALRIGDFERLPTPSWLSDSIVLSELMTFGTLTTELAIAILVWNRTARPWVLGLGVLMHLGIAITLDIGFFSVAVLTMYLAFVPPERAEALLTGGRDRVRARRQRRVIRRRRSDGPQRETGDGQASLSN